MATIHAASGDDLLFVFFMGIQVDGTDVDKQYYTYKQGSLIITLHSDYLDTLSVGKHTLTALFKDGQKQDIPFTVSATDPTPTPTPRPVPKTGDDGNPALWAGLMLLGIGALAVVLGMIAWKRKF